MNIQTLNRSTFLKALISFLVVAGLSSGTYVASAEDIINEDLIESTTEDLDCTIGEESQIKDGDLTYVMGCAELIPATTEDTNPPNKFRNHWNPYQSKRFTCGSSWIETKEIGYLLYRGTAYVSGQRASGGDCGGSGRVYRAMMSYKRNGTTLSSATVFVKEKKTISATDDLRPRYPRTTFHYTFILGP